MKIAISSGHCLKVRGASSEWLDEVNESRKVVSKLSEMISCTKNYVFTFNDDTSKTQQENLKTIADWHNSKNCDVNLFIHFNAASKTTNPRGVEVLYKNKINLANEISSEISKYSGLTNRGAKKRTDLYVLNNCKNKSVLLEICFVDSLYDANTYKDKFDEICKGIVFAVTGELVNIDNSKRAWDFFKSKNLTDEVCAGILGNLYAESGINPRNMENGYEKKLNFTDDTYTECVDNGTYKNFIIDGVGFGIAQFTYSGYKKILYDTAKSKSLSVGNLDLQLQVLYDMLIGNQQIRNSLKNAKSVKEASNVILLQYEKPYDQSMLVQNLRAKYSQDFYDKYSEVDSEMVKPIDLLLNGKKKTVGSIQKVDENGGVTNYLSIREIGEILGAKVEFVQNRNPQISITI